MKLEDFADMLAKPIAEKIAEKVEVQLIPDRPLSLAEAAEVTGLSYSHLKNLVRKGLLKTCPGTPTRIPREEVARMNKAEAGKVNE